VYRPKILAWVAYKIGGGPKKEPHMKRVYKSRKRAKEQILRDSPRMLKGFEGFVLGEVLLASAKNGDLKEVARLIKVAGADIDYADREVQRQWCSRLDLN
jgi:hypothetical protein